MNSFELAQYTTEQFNARLERVIGTFQKRIIAALSGLETANGKALMTEANLNYATAIYPQLLQELENAGFGDVVKYLLDNNGKLIKSLKTVSGVPLAFTETSVNVISALQQSQLANFTAISQRAVNAIREEVTRTVLTGSRIEDALDVIRDVLEPQFQRYAYTYANTALRDTMQAAIDEGVAQAKADGVEIFWEYTGPDDDKTRDACIELLNIQYFTDSEREEWEAATADERAYNCRHAFVPISREAYEESEGLGKP